MRIVLVNPAHPAIRPEDEQESLGPAYLAAVARRDGHEVEIIDAGAHRWPPAKAAAAILEGPEADLVGVSVMFQETIPAAMAVIAALRRGGYQGHVVIGGHPPTFLWPELCRDYEGFDSVVVGEGEETFAELSRAIERNEDWTSLPGLAAAGEARKASAEAGAVTAEATASKAVAAGAGARAAALVPRPLVPDLDRLPFPARDTLSGYLARSRGRRTASVLRSRGCYGNCSFCDTRAFYAASPGPAWRVRSAANVADEIEVLVRDHRVEAVRFWDDNFIGPGRKGREAAEELAREFLRRSLGVRFSFECRVTDVDPDLFRLLREAGLSRVFLGVEAMTQRQLDFHSKMVTVADNQRALDVLRSLDVPVTIGMIMFDPDTTVAELETNLAFLKATFGGWAESRENVARPWNRLEVYAGTPVAETLRRQGRLKGDYLGYDYDFADRAVGRIYRSGNLIRRLGLPIRDALARLRR